MAGTQPRMPWTGVGLALGAGIGSIVGLVGWGAAGIAVGLVGGGALGLLVGSTAARRPR